MISLLTLTAAALLTRHPLVIGAAAANLLVNIVVYAFDEKQAG